MDKILHFFKKYSKAIDASEITQKNTLSIVKKLIRYDPLDITTFEISFKIKRDNLLNQIRFLNMDGDAYSCKNPLFFLSRLRIYKKIIEGKVNNPLLTDIFKALSWVARTPMDLYFGADIKKDNYLFSFWLIFGGVKRTGEVSFWPYDFNEIVENILKIIKFKPPEFLKKEILNFGVDVDNKNLFYKLYYLIREKSNYAYLVDFNKIIRKINRALSDFKYFYFFSQMYNKKGVCFKKKLFLEFLQDIHYESEKINELLTKILKINNSHFELKRLLKIIKLISGRVSLISFEIDGTITFYIRPN